MNTLRPHNVNGTNGTNGNTAPENQSAAVPSCQECQECQVDSEEGDSWECETPENAGLSVKIASTAKQSFAKKSTEGLRRGVAIAADGFESRIHSGVGNWQRRYGKATSPPPPKLVWQGRKRMLPIPLFLWEGANVHKNPENIFGQKLHKEKELGRFGKFTVENKPLTEYSLLPLYSQ